MHTLTNFATPSSDLTKSLGDPSSEFVTTAHGYISISLSCGVGYELIMSTSMETENTSRKIGRSDDQVISSVAAVARTKD